MEPEDRIGILVTFNGAHGYIIVHIYILFFSLAIVTNPSINFPY